MWQQRFPYPKTMETITFCVSDRVLPLPIEQICSVRRRRRCGALSSKREREQKKKGSLLFTKSLERVETIGGSLDGGRETAHTFGTLFYRISIGHGTSVRSERAYVTRNIELSYYFLLSLSAYTARHRSGVNTLTVASQFPIVFFFFHHHVRHFYRAIEYSPFDPLVVALFLLLYTSFLPSFDCVILIVFILRATILISRMIAIFGLLPRLANSSPRILLTKSRGERSTEGTSYPGIK